VQRLQAGRAEGTEANIFVAYGFQADKSAESLRYLTPENMPDEIKPPASRR
jgi:hypothetical protein